MTVDADWKQAAAEIAKWEPAFPIVVPGQQPGVIVGVGLSVRDYFAGQVLAGLMSGGDAGKVPQPDQAAVVAYLWADAMMRHRAKTIGETHE